MVLNTQYLTIANGITVGRLFIFGGSLWWLFLGDTNLAIWWFGIAWGLDAVDGVVARAMNQASAFGSQLDKIVDRIIVMLGLLAFIRVGLLPRMAVLLLTKDIALLPATTILAAHNKRDDGLGEFGKMVTLLQGVSILWLVLGYGQQYQVIVIGLVALLGFTAAFFHLRKIVLLY